MFRGPSRQEAGAGALFSRFALGDVFDGDDTTLVEMGTVLGDGEPGVRVGMGNTVMVYVYSKLSVPTLATHIRYIDFTIRYFGKAISAAGDPRLFLKADTDLFPRGSYYSTDVVPEVGRVEQSGALAISGVNAGDTAFGSTILRHQWVVHRVPNPLLPENAPINGGGGIPVVVDIAKGDFMRVYARLVPMDLSVEPIFREGESIQFAAVWGATARTP